MKFIKFLELYKTTTNYLSALQDEFGISPDDLAKVPQVAANFGLKQTYNLAPFRILKFGYNDRGEPKTAEIEIMDSNLLQRVYRKLGDKYVRMPKDKVEKGVVVVPIDQINTLLSQGFGDQNEISPMA